MSVIDRLEQTSAHEVAPAAAQLLQQQLDPHPYRAVSIARYAIGLGVDQAVADYGLPRAAVEQALALYEAHRPAIEARLPQEPPTIIESESK